MLTVPKHISSPQICSGVRVARYLVFCVDNCLLFRPISFGLCIVCLSSIHDLWITHFMSSNFSFFPTVLYNFDDFCLLPFSGRLGNKCLAFCLLHSLKQRYFSGLKNILLLLLLNTLRSLNHCPIMELKKRLLE